MNNKIELLAPAGDLEKLKVAFAYGADAVFCGGKEYSLRTRASNFDIEDIKKACEVARQYNGKLYVTCNIFPLNDDLLDLKDLKRYLRNKQVSLKDEDIFFVNPCIEYLIVLTKEVNKNKFKNKRDYQELFKKYFGVSDYAGHIPQVENIVEQLTVGDFDNFVDNLRHISSDDNVLPSTNFLYFIDKVRK